MNRTITIVAGVFGASSLVLVDSAVKGTALLVVAAVAAIILWRDSAATRHLVWLLAMAAMLVVPVLSALLPRWRVLPEWVRIPAATAVVRARPPALTRPADRAIEVARQADREGVASPSAAYRPVAGPPDSRPASVTQAAIPAPAVASGSWLDPLPLVWAIGSCVFILRLIAARWLLARTERQGTKIGSSGQPALTRDPIVMALEAACSQLGVCRPVTLLIHPDKAIPVVWGILRCRLMLPAAARHWSGERVRSVLLHELAHVKRRDTLAQLLAQLACALHWFNPLVWLAGWRLGVECERACDDRVLASGVRPSAYAGHLLDVVTGFSPAGWTHSGGLAMARKSSLERRLVAVLSDNLNRRDVSVALAAIALALAAGIAVPVAMLRAADDEPGARDAADDEPGARDVMLREIIAGPTVFVKNNLEVKGTLVARGFANQTLDVELFVEDIAVPVAHTKLKVPDGKGIVPITGLKYMPQSPGEKKITLKVAAQEGEILKSNNEISTFVTVLSGGLNVLFLQGSNSSWDYRFLMRSITTRRDIHIEGVVIKTAAQGDRGALSDEEFAPGRYNAYVLSDLKAGFLTPKQQRMLAEAVRQGAGLMMLGGHASFGAGGWADTPLAGILPVHIHPGDGYFEPEEGIKFVPTNRGLESYLLQVGTNRTETARIWDLMTPILGTNRFSDVKESASILAETAGLNPEPLLATMNVGKGRSIAYGGDTWRWYRASEESRLAHRKFWLQVVFWLSHKEDQGHNQVKVTLDRRRVAVGEKIELTATTHDAKGAPIPNVTYEVGVEREKADPPVSSPVDLYKQGDEGKGSIYAVEKVGQPANYTVTVNGKKDGQEIGRGSARFLVYQDDRELEKPPRSRATTRSK
jgi:beta-lactamase regulating signal transducer with metallopeptidase domain/uncharacterized membrane protein